MLSTITRGDKFEQYIQKILRHAGIECHRVRWISHWVLSSCYASEVMLPLCVKFCPETYYVGKIIVGTVKVLAENGY